MCGSIELIDVKDVAKILHTSPRKISSGILNGTMPIGAVLTEGKNTVVRIPRARFDAWVEGRL